MRPHEVVDEDAVLQVAVADGHALESLFLHDGLEDGRARNDHVGPVGIDARHGFAFLKSAGTQFLDGAAQAVVAEDMLGSRGSPARARGVLLLQRGGDFREVLGRARTGDGFGDLEPRDALEGVQGLVADVALQRRVGIGGNRPFVVLKKQVGQAHAAELERIEVRIGLRVAHDELGAAAADVDEQPEAFALLQPAGNAEVDEARLFAARYGREVYPGLFLHAADKFGAVDGVAHGSRGDGDDFRRPIDRAHFRQPAQHSNGAGHRFLLKAAVGEPAFAEANHVLDLVQDRRGTVRMDADEQQTHRVAAEIDDADDFFRPA